MTSTKGRHIDLGSALREVAGSAAPAMPDIERARACGKKEAKNRTSRWKCVSIAAATFGMLVGSIAMFIPSMRKQEPSVSAMGLAPDYLLIASQEAARGALGIASDRVDEHNLRMEDAIRAYIELLWKENDAPPRGSF